MPDLKDIVSVKYSKYPVEENTQMASVTAFSTKDGTLADGSLVEARQFDTVLSAEKWKPEPAEFRDDALWKDALLLPTGYCTYHDDLFFVEELRSSWPWQLISGTKNGARWEVGMRRLPWVSFRDGSDNLDTHLVITRVHSFDASLGLSPHEVLRIGNAEGSGDL
ncbi:MAG: hypothetical protein TREMPRED_006057 [Tremellales sp. Tagirdzhanova-0007]|nr:MAG: hypothetical protein TREMPRED_006057 [Tremellales sp. Tagirdzhanova-0007]